MQLLGGLSSALLGSWARVKREHPRVNTGGMGSVSGIAVTPKGV